MDIEQRIERLEQLLLQLCESNFFWCGEDKSIKQVSAIRSELHLAEINGQERGPK